LCDCAASRIIVLTGDGKGYCRDHARFLAGGEFPVPINGAASSAGGVPTITVEFESFGASLALTPTVKSSEPLTQLGSRFPRD
jgi:hypothetical protein